MEKREKFSISIGDRETRIILDPKELAAYRDHFSFDKTPCYYVYYK